MLDSATIATISTPLGQGALGVIRISGPESAEIARSIFRSERGKSVTLTPKQSHRVFYGRIVDPDTRQLIDEVVLTWLAGPHSFTTEDTVEISCHGGPLPLRETLRVIIGAGSCLAEPGDYTLRAFFNGRLDLSQAE